MTVVVTGATGHIGANLVRALLERDEKVRVTVREDTRAIEGLEVEGDSIAGQIRVTQEATWPHSEFSDGRRTFIVNSAGTIYFKDQGDATAVDAWPDDPPADNWVAQ